jgi:Tfp pilus assembly protein PilP
MPRKENKTRKRRPEIILCSVLVCAFVCSGETFASQELVYKQPRDSAGELKKGSTGNETVGYIYDPRGKTDPFKSFIAEQEAIKEKKESKPRTYLETLDLSQLDLIAIVVDSKEKWAMVRESKGLGHVIRKGTPIGTNGGVVFEINESEVVIREKYKDFRGQVSIKDISKKLPSLQ